MTNTPGSCHCLTNQPLLAPDHNDPRQRLRNPLGRVTKLLQASDEKSRVASAVRMMFQDERPPTLPDLVALHIRPHRIGQNGVCILSSRAAARA